MMTDHLEPCPFCGGGNVNSKGRVQSSRGVVGCEDCGADGPHSAYDAIHPVPTWNTRAPSSREAAAVSLLRRLLENPDTLWFSGDFNQAELDLLKELTKEGQTQ